MKEIGDTHQFDLMLFVLSLLGAPISVTLLGLIFVPVFPVISTMAIFAVPLGAPYYLIFGGPVLYLWTRFMRPDPIITALMLLLVNVALFRGAELVNIQYFEILDPETVKLNFRFGSVFATLWGFAFGAIYCTAEKYRS